MLGTNEAVNVNTKNMLYIDSNILCKVSCYLVNSEWSVLNNTFSRIQLFYSESIFLYKMNIMFIYLYFKQMNQYPFT